MSKIDDRMGLPSASKVSRYFACEGSYQLEQGCADFRTQEMVLWAESGDRVHAYLAGELAADGLSEKELDVANMCREQERSILQKITENTDWDEVREQRLWILNKLSGKPDVIFMLRGYQDSFGVVFDYKAGYGEQDPASENNQIRTNIVLAAEKYTDIEKWYGAIISPLTESEPELVAYTLEDVALAKRGLLALLERIKIPNAPLNAGDQCRWCPAVLKCEAAMALMQSFGLIDTTSAEGKTLANYLVLAKAAKPIIKSIEDRAKKLLKDGAIVPGWKLGKPGSTRSITDPFEAFNMLEKANLISRDVFLTQCISVGITNLTKAVAKHNTITQKAAESAVGATLVSVIAFDKKEPSLEQEE